MRICSLDGSINDSLFDKFKQAGMKPDCNTYRQADHMLVTFDHIGEHVTREYIANVAAAGFDCELDGGQSNVRGVAVIEKSNGNIHGHVAIRCDDYHDPRTIIRRCRQYDVQHRPSNESAGQAQSKASEMQDATEGKHANIDRMHMNISFCHVYNENDAQVKSGKKKAGHQKAKWKFNDQVAYLLMPVKNKEIDCTPFFLIAMTNQFG